CSWPKTLPPPNRIPNVPNVAGSKLLGVLAVVLAVWRVSFPWCCAAPNNVRSVSAYSGTTETKHVNKRKHPIFFMVGNYNPVPFYEKHRKLAIKRTRDSVSLRQRKLCTGR